MAKKEVLLDMKKRPGFILIALLALSVALGGCDIFSAGKIRIVDIKMAESIDANLMPVDPANTFPKGTSKIYCWFKWKDAEVNSQMMAKWHYVTENINILSYPVTIPRRSGTGSVALTMPKGKILPNGSYRVDLVLDNRKLKSCKFKVE